MNEKRNLRRKNNYKILIDAGFTPAQATVLKDRKKTEVIYLSSKLKTFYSALKEKSEELYGKKE